MPKKGRLPGADASCGHEPYYAAVFVMVLSKDDIRQEIIEAWRSYIERANLSLEELEKELPQPGESAKQVSEEWVHSLDKLIREIADTVFSVGEPEWAGAGEKDAELMKKLKQRVYNFDSRLHQLKKNPHPL
jgi:hypothetical protein